MYFRRTGHKICNLHKHINTGRYVVEMIQYVVGDPKETGADFFCGQKKIPAGFGLSACGVSQSVLPSYLLTSTNRDKF